MKGLATQILGLGALVAAALHCGSDGSGPTGDDPADGGPSVPPGTIVHPVTALPALPELPLQSVFVRKDSVNVEVTQIDGAKDYRIYELPHDGDVSAASDGTVVVKNATYRCAGERQAPEVQADSEPQRQSTETHTTVVGGVYGFSRTLATATLGYVYPTAGPARSPVYRLGDSAPDADIGYYFQRWNESRLKRWTTSSADRDSKLAARWRDDGTHFYAPDDTPGRTQPVYFDTDDDYLHAGAFGHPRNIFYTDGTEKTFYKSKSAAVAFHVFKNQEPGTLPLMRVFYESPQHDELAVGGPAFQRAYHQGNVPISFLHWSNLGATTTLVVEALSDGCPFQGLHAAKSLAATGNYQAYVTPDDQRKASPTGEIFINGQFDGTKPKPIARTFIQVNPGAAPAMDWFESFDGLQAPPLSTDCGDANCFGRLRATTPDYDFNFYAVDQAQCVFGTVMGEFWVTWADLGSDLPAKFRFAPKKKTTVGDSTFLHVTMEVDAVSTSRRYPQIIISDQDVPVQDKLKQGNTVVVQPFTGWPNHVELQVCDHRVWDVNDQCPAIPFRERSPSVYIPPSPEVGERAGVDKPTLLDVYLSSKRAYLFLDALPYGCVDLPATGTPKGAATVTFGDVLYHSGADEPVVDGTYRFHLKHQYIETKRHFDNLGFKAGAPTPAWDANRFPCYPASDIGSARWNK